MLGRLELANSVTPVEVALSKATPAPGAVLSGNSLVGEASSVDCESPVIVGGCEASVEDAGPFDPDVKYSPSLTKEQSEKVKRMLREECESFMRNEDDINVIEELEAPPPGTTPSKFDLHRPVGISRFWSEKVDLVGIGRDRSGFFIFHHNFYFQH